MKSFLSGLLFFCMAFSVIAQSPKTISYQAILRDNIGVLIQNAPNVSVKVSLLQGNIIDDNVIYQENHSTSTNANGLFTIEIGAGTVAVGSYPAIQWGNGPYFLKTEIDPLGGTNYLITAISELLSVPLANYAFEAARLPGVAGLYAGWYQQSPESIAQIGLLFESDSFGLSYTSPTRLMFHLINTNDGTYYSMLTEVSESNPNVLTIYFDQSFTFNATWNNGVLTFDFDGTIGDFIKL